MITIVFELSRYRDGRDHYRITADGHAGAGPYGHDIVCAAVSVLMDTLCESLLSAAEAGCLSPPLIRRESGAYVIEADMPPQNTCEGVDAYATFATIWRGLRLVAAAYPQNISIQTRTG